MNFDWSIDVHDNFLANFKRVAELDDQIKNARNLEKDQLKDERRRLWIITGNKLCDAYPFYSARIKTLTLLSANESESLKDVCRKPYIEIVFKNGKQSVEKGCAEVETLLEIFKTPVLNDINDFPPFSFFLQFTFELAKPYLSKDDEEFYICENPIRKDKVFKVPMVSGSSWKGNMRWTAGKLIELKVSDPEEKLLRRIQLSKLFGHENEAEKRYFDSLMSDDKRTAFEAEMKSWSTNGLRSGRLNFYPTFFDQIGLEVINPHDRKTKAGTQPIYIESVPTGATGMFSLLYVPFDLMGKPQNQIRDEVITDLDMVCKALRAMMLTYGFSAKKGSGFGIVREDFYCDDSDGSLNIRHAEVKKYVMKTFSELSNRFETVQGLIEGQNGR